MLKIKGLLAFILLLLCCVKTHAQQKGTTVNLFYEKVYIHTDRDQYTQGDDVWFKAYLLNAQNNKPMGYSNNLYVELISPGLKIVARQTLRLEGGLANGDFKLRDTLSAGTYRLRAYTNWMRNFGDKFIFEKNVAVVALSGTAVNKLVTKPVKNPKLKPNLNAIKDTLPVGPLVRFFPESGYLINDVLSNVAFKAEDEAGHGIAVSGNIIASSGRMVAKFSCDSTGMSTFLIRPDDTQDYHAEVTINGKPYSFNIVAPLHKGFVLSINTVPGTIVVDIGCNGFTLNESAGTDLVIVAQHGGKTVYKQHITIKTKNGMVQIPDANFPEGIACITLFNEYGKAIAERLFYVNRSDATKLTVNTDKPIYIPKEQVIVKIKLSDTVKAHLSLSAVDANEIPVKDGDILSYLTLRSEIKGNIEHPEKLFDTANLNRFIQIDRLLLTQGWRSYVWQRIADSIPVIKYDVEQGINIKGKVRKVFANKAMNGINITMFAPKAEGSKLFTAVTDTAGRFNINGAVFYGYQYLNFSSRDIKGIKDDGTSKGHTGGWVQVDSLADPMAVHAPAIVSAQAFADTVIQKKKFTFTGDNTLKTVQITDNSSVLPPIELAVTKAEQKDYESLLNYLLYTIPGSWMDLGKDTKAVLPKLKWGHFPKTDPFCQPYTIPVIGVYVDKSKINYQRLQYADYMALRMSDVLKVTINRRYFICGILYSVKLVLRPGALEVKDYYDNTMADMVGYYNARSFFAPRYESSNANPDYRTTIHWEPNITTDANGEATITYYNADPKSKIKLIVQGVNNKGILLTAGAGYEVK